MPTHRISVAFLAAVLGTAPLGLATAKTDMTQDLATAQFGTPEDTSRKDLDLRHWPENMFRDNVAMLIRELSDAHGPEKPAVMMNLTELYLSQMLLFEAETALAGTRPQSQKMNQRYRALKDATALLAGRPLADITTSPLTFEMRPDRSFWLTLHAIAASDPKLLKENLALGFAGMVYQPRPVLRAVLPSFIEAAIALEKSQLANQAIQLLDAIPDLAQSPVGYFLRGRAALLEGNQKTALGFFFEGTNGWDRYAARCRLAVAEMALENGAHGALLAARDVLSEGVDSWRGDKYEFEILDSLTVVYRRLGDHRGGLLTYGQIVARFPLDEKAQLARDEAEKLLDKVYDEGAAGNLALAEWMEIHLRIQPMFRTFARLPDHVEKLADRALKLGGTSLAITEYRRTLSLLDLNANRIPADELTEKRMRVLYKLANAQNQAGQYFDARDTLSQIDPAEDGKFREKVYSLKAKVLAETGDADLVLRTYVANPDAEHLRNIGKVLVQEEKWHEAVTFYDRLWAGHSDEFTAEDATYLLIAARRIGDTSTANAVIASFPGLTQSSGWINLAKGILEPAAGIMPLREDAASRRLESLERTLQKVKDSGF
ncbi:MAG: hypothetical protein MRY77_13855 [Rhodobacteraceae bacterium]|nr:hypothetical protein [Paracoccaceae bacterium]